MKFPETKLQLSNIAYLPEEESMTTRLALSQKCTNSRGFSSVIEQNIFNLLHIGKY